MRSRNVYTCIERSDSEARFRDFDNDIGRVDEDVIVKLRWNTVRTEATRDVVYPHAFHISLGKERLDLFAKIPSGDSRINTRC